MPGVSGISVKERHVFRWKSKNGQIFELLAASFLNGHIVESNEAARRKGRVMLSTTIGVNVRMNRLELGWSQERLAFTSGVCVRTISAIECGTANPTSDVIESLARALGVPVSRLVA